MFTRRAAILLIGPILLIGGAYYLTLAGSSDQLSAATVVDAAPPHAEETSLNDSRLNDQCRKTADSAASLLGSDCRLIVRAPFVIGGNLPLSELEHHYRTTLLPTSRALATSYFDSPPDAPITILMFADERSYRDQANRLHAHAPAAYYGFYQRADRRIVLNIATGTGTLAHELTHALAHFDFPKMPEWFDEGLASLHEQSEFTDDQLQLRGGSNWRLNYLIPAVREDRLRSLREMLAEPSVRKQHEAVDYAHARYFCLFLQQRGLLSHFYRKFRTTALVDPTGRETLCQIHQTDDLSEIDAQFRAWVLKLAEDR